MRLSICNTPCVWLKRHRGTENKWCLENTFRPTCVSLQVVRNSITLQSSGSQQSLQSLKRSTDLWVKSHFEGPCSAQRCSGPPISHPGSVWRAASAPCPHFSSRCPPCRGCAGEYILSQSLGSGISHSGPVSEPGVPRWRSSHSSPIPSRGKYSDGGARAFPTRARLARARAPLGWRRRGRNVRPPPPRGRPATGQGSWKCRGNQLHTGASTGDRGLMGEEEEDGEVDDCLLLY